MLCLQKWIHSGFCINCSFIIHLTKEYGEELIGGKRMPYSIRKLPNRRLYTVKGPGRTFAKATTLKKAKAQVRMLYMLERQNTKGTRRQR